MPYFAKCANPPSQSPFPSRQPRQLAPEGVGPSRNRVSPPLKCDKAPRLQLLQVAQQGANRNASRRLQLPQGSRLVLERAEDLDPPRVRERSGQLVKHLDGRRLWPQGLSQGRDEGLRVYPGRSGTRPVRDLQTH